MQYSQTGMIFTLSHHVLYLIMLFPQRSWFQNLRYFEWIFITVHFGMWLSQPDVPLAVLLRFYGIFLGLSWIFPLGRPLSQRILYLTAGLGSTIAARLHGIDLSLFIFFYFAKGCLLVNQRTTLWLCLLTMMPWTISEYWVEVSKLQLPVSLPTSANMLLGTLAVYAAASTFVFKFCSMLMAEEKNHHQIAELSEQVRSLAISLERTRIAREIHDSLGHSLTDLDTQLALSQTLRSRDLEQSFQAVDTAKLLARQCIEDVSQAIDQMRQSNFDLNHALIGLGEQLRQSSGIEIKWQVNLPQLPIYKSYQIYCIVKEALMNVQKHAQASRVTFNGHLVSEGILIDLVDNGIGFDISQFTTGFGLQGIRERVELMGGKLNIKTARTQGTHLQVFLPL
jgi:signal transduction histidine kinase